MKTKIGSKRVPVQKGETVAYFAGGAHGEHEAGDFLFWTAVCQRTPRCKARPIIGRSLRGLGDPGERFRRIFKETTSAGTLADRRAYKRAWKVLQHVILVRPANPMEVARWLSTHATDACFVKKITFP